MKRKASSRSVHHARPPAARRGRTSRPSRPSRTAVHPHPKPEGAAFGIHAILVPIDFSVHSKNALKYALPLAEKFKASIRLVYVVEPTVYPADLGFGQVVLPGVEDELREKGGEELHGLIEREIGGRLAASYTVRTGNPYQEILREAEDRGVDLIVVAAHGHSGMEHMLFGSTADRIVRHAHCAVLTVRPE
jgi:nucleotide-binding universal stress UspA family protein